MLSRSEILSSVADGNKSHFKKIKFLYSIEKAKPTEPGQYLRANSFQQSTTSLPDSKRNSLRKGSLTDESQYIIKKQQIDPNESFDSIKEMVRRKMLSLGLLKEVLPIDRILILKTDLQENEGDKIESTAELCKVDRVKVFVKKSKENKEIKLNKNEVKIDQEEMLRLLDSLFSQSYVQEELADCLPYSLEVLSEDQKSEIMLAVKDLVKNMNKREQTYTTGK